MIIKRAQEEVENNAEKKFSMLRSKLCLRIDGLATVNIINDLQEKNEKATGIEHKVKSIKDEVAVPDAESDGEMLFSHKFFSVKKSDFKGSAELHTEQRKAERQRNKSRVPNERNAQAAHD